MRILVVDDDEKITRMLRRGLTLEGHAVDAACDGQQALRLIAQAAYDLVILDVMMSGPDGLEVCRRLRAAGEGLPVLMLTARDAVADRVSGLDAGADDYLIKPFAYEELLARVRALLRRRTPDSAILRFADLSLDAATWEARRGERILETLSPTEMVQVIGPDGRVVARSANLGAQMPPADEGEVQRALAGQPVYTIIHQPGLWLRIYLAPLTENGRVIGLLWVARSMQTLGAALDLLQTLLLGVGLLALLSAGAWGWMLARDTLRPVDDLTRTAHAIGQTEDFARRVKYSGPPDEIGRLAATFNSMLASLESAHRAT